MCELTPNASGCFSPECFLVADPNRTLPWLAGFA